MATRCNILIESGESRIYLYRVRLARSCAPAIGWINIPIGADRDEYAARVVCGPLAQFRADIINAVNLANAMLDIGRKNNPGMYGTADRIPDPVENATPAPAGWGSVQS